MHVIRLNLCIIGDKKEARKTGEIGTDDHLFIYLLDYYFAMFRVCVC